MNKLLIYGSKGVPTYQKDPWNVAVNSWYLQSGKKQKIWSKTTPKDYMVKKTYYLAPYFSSFWAIGICRKITSQF